MDTRCQFCGSTHASKECPNYNNEQIPDFKLKCCLCAGEHRSTDPECPRRQHFIEMRQHLSHRRSTTPAKTNMNLNNFPHLPKSKFSYKTSFNEQQQQSTASLKYSSWFNQINVKNIAQNSYNPNFNHNKQQQYFSQQRESQHQNNKFFFIFIIFIYIFYLFSKQQTIV